MQLEVKTYLYDIRCACELLQQFAANRSAADYRQDMMFQSAVERQFEIIGETVNQALKLDSALDDRISYAQKIVDFRNLLIHGYRFVDSEEVWRILQDDLPRLHTEVERLLQDDPE